MVEGTLFCPLCGALMTRQEKGWYYPLGQTFIAWAVVVAITEAMGQIRVPLATERPGRPSEHSGYCPRCAQQFTSDSGGTRGCPRCGLSLRGGVFHVLRKYGDHRAVAGTYAIAPPRERRPWWQGLFKGAV